MKIPVAIAFCMIAASGAAAMSAKDAWVAAITKQNAHYAQAPRAMLKIQDVAYLGNGDTAFLIGNRGQPASWHWSRRPGGLAVLRVSISGGKLSVVQNNKPMAPISITNGISIDKDIDIWGEPTQVGADVPGWRIFLYNQQNPMAKRFTGVSYFPYDPAFRVTARFLPDARLPPRVFRTSRGTDKQFYHAGDAGFVLNGKAVTLPFYSETNQPGAIKDMSAFFTDDLTGKGAYGSGRYVDVDDFGTYPPAKLVIEFNQAYNPNCARSPHFTCPIATDSIPIPIKAGEHDPHASH